jgi:NADPH2:quinone reductase
MWAQLCREWGDADDLEFDEVDEPEMVEGGVRINIKAAGLNFADTLMIKGEYQVKPQQPFSPGLEVAGVVIECAAGVTRVKEGDRVMAVVHYGGYAEQVVTDESDVYVIPDNMDFVSAAAFPIVYGTSHVGLKNKLKLNEGETILVNGAAGGVGLTAVELAKKMGAEVIASAGGADKLKVAADMGADHLIDYRSEDIRARTKIFTQGRGVDAVYDPVGGSAFEASLRATAQGGRILVVGFASGTVPQIPANILLVKNISVIGFYWGAHRFIAPLLLEDSFRELLGWYAAGELSPHVSHTYDLADAGKALKMLSSRAATGKIVLQM